MKRARTVSTLGAEEKVAFYEAAMEALGMACGYCHISECKARGVNARDEVDCYAEGSAYVVECHHCSNLTCKEHLVDRSIGIICVECNQAIFEGKSSSSSE